MPVMAIENEIDAGVDALVTHARKLGNTAAPLRRITSDEIVAFAGKLLVSGGHNLRIGAHQLHVKLLNAIRKARDMIASLRPRGQAQNRSIVTEKHAVSGTMRHKPRAAVGCIQRSLSLVRLEDKRQSCNDRVRPPLHVPRRPGVAGIQFPPRKRITRPRHLRTIGQSTVRPESPPEKSTPGPEQYQGSGNNANSGHGRAPPAAIYVHA